MWRSWAMAGLALFLGWSTAGAQERGPGRGRPNILLILADDVGYSDLACQGSEIKTPNLDALATTGVRFTHFYNSARCCPSRAAIMTGVHPSQAGFQDMTGRLPANVATIPEVLKTAGYSTYMVGKWHLSEQTKPTDRGFDEFYGMLGGVNSFWQEHPFYTRWPKGRPAREYGPGEFYSTNAFGDYALDFLEEGRKAGKPWFLYLSFNAAHFPLHAPEEDVARYEPLYADGWDKMRERRLARMKELGLVPKDLALTPRTVVPRNWANAGKEWAADKPIPAWDALPEDRRKDLTRRMATFAAMVELMDRNIGRVVDHLKQSGQFENTIIFYLSDNGACAEWDPFGFDEKSGPKNVLHTGDDLKFIGSPGSYVSYGSGWANACSTPYRYYKQYTHEGGVLTPLIVHYPAGVSLEPGTLIPQTGYITDLMSTCVEAAGATYPAERDGVKILPTEGASLWPILKGGDRPARPIFIEHEGSKAVREGDWKLVQERNGHPAELYNLADDPTEMHDLAAAQPDRVAAMTARWDDWARRCRVEPIPPRVSRGTIELRAGQTLSDAEAPGIAGEPIRIEATVQDASRDGVIASQGAQVQGWSLFVRDGRPAFAVRRDGKLLELTADRAVGDGPVDLAGVLRKDGSASLLVGGVEAARGEAGGCIPSQPKDPLIVGDDRQGAVGSYRTPMPFGGSILRARLTVGEAATPGR